MSKRYLQPAMHIEGKLVMCNPRAHYRWRRSIELKYLAYAFGNYFAAADASRMIIWYQTCRTWNILQVLHA